MTSWKQFALLALFGCVMLAGMPTFLVMAEYGYQYQQVENPQSQPESSPTPYGALTASEQQAVDAAIDDEIVMFETESAAPPLYVEKSGTIYQFYTAKKVDWSDPRTPASTLVSLTGLVGLLAVVRRDMRQ